MVYSRSAVHFSISECGCLAFLSLDINQNPTLDFEYPFTIVAWTPLLVLVYPVPIVWLICDMMEWIMNSANKIDLVLNFSN